LYLIFLGTDISHKHSFSSLYCDRGSNVGGALGNGGSDSDVIGDPSGEMAAISYLTFPDDVAVVDLTA
jgi:hypothetical protein